MTWGDEIQQNKDEYWKFKAMKKAASSFGYLVSVRSG